MNGLISYYHECRAEFMNIPINSKPVNIYNKHGKKASRLGRWSYSNQNFQYLANLSYKIGAIIQERLAFKEILMMGKFNTIEEWFNYLEFDDRIFVEMLLNQEHVKY